MSSCPTCGEANPDRAKFCLQCGTPLIGPTPMTREERKVVSVLFCDLVGFTQASEAADPEDVSARLRSYHARMREEIERFGGTVEKFIGDAVMAVFGAPVAHEDDAERAVRTGLRLLESVDELNAADPALSLQVRVGINTGEAVVALGVRADTGEGFIAGDVVNTASRLQGAASVNGLVVSEQTYRATSRVFEWERLEPVTVKGKAEPLAIWQPVRARARLGSDVTRSPDTPMVGRELERDLLSGAFARAATQASSQLVTVVGEPGVGKSRLCAELLKEVEAGTRLVRWRQGRCLPYGDGISFWPLGEIVKAECGILESDSPSEAADKLALNVAADDPERGWLLARLAPLVGAPADPAGLDESFAAWRRFCEGLAAERPTVLVFEDLHWADDALLAFLEQLTDWVESVPLLLLCTARPELFERHPTFGASARNAQRINLAPLGEAETGQLVARLLDQAMLPEATRQRLLERAGGNPLYAEEFVRLLADRHDDTDAGVPDSIQALIAARLDTLPADRKSLLQDAAVVGKVFWGGAVAAMGDRDPSMVTQALHDLARKELVRPVRGSSMAGEHEYTFWHVLVRDVCYAQIPRLDRATRHRAAAAWIERAVGDRVADLADVLAYHYLAALELHEATGEREQAAQLRSDAVRVLALAGARALVLDTARAERQLSRALELASPDAPERASLLEHWGRAIWQQGRLREGRDALEQALAMRRGRGDWVAAARILTQLQLLYYRLGDTSGSAIEEAIELLEAEPAGPDLVAAYERLAGHRSLAERDREALEAADRAIALAQQLGLPEPAFGLHWRGIARFGLGDAEGVDDIERALRLAIDQGLGRETGVIYGNLAWAFGEERGPAAALQAAEEGIAFCEARGITELAVRDRGLTLLHVAELGRTEEALTQAESIADHIQATGDMQYTEIRELQLRLLAEVGRPWSTPELRAFVAQVAEFDEPRKTAEATAVSLQSLLAGRRLDEARELAADLERIVADDPAALYRSTVPRAVRSLLTLGDHELAQRLVESIVPSNEIARLSLASSRAQLAEAAGDLVDAARQYRGAADGWDAFGDLPEEAYARLGQGRCLAALGDPATDVPLRRARELFATLGFAPALAETETLLASTPLETPETSR